MLKIATGLGINSSFDLSFHVEDNNLWVELGSLRLVERIVCNRELDAVQAANQLKALERGIIVYNRVVLKHVPFIISSLNCFVLNVLDILVKLLCLLFLKASQSSIEKF